MSQLISCGLLIKVQNKYLLVHATQPDSYVYNEKDKFWSVPKGIQNGSETQIETAVREAQEETTIDITQFFDINNAIQLPDIFMKKKTVKIFLINEPDESILNIKLTCPSLINNKTMPYMNGKPEVDLFKWATREEAYNIVFKSQQCLFSD